ncbi:ATP-binding protein [Pseudalkalibacillus berkeleyi]|uniref:AAA family ATPase n=1 Tax=Pseudalkalibacillus berkeleyi TaxID=1069813 RepID=A0ABS9GU11_9BACL|nr:AAA family ATPase [Pseudalkalibacillus berkeleyi]MCF6136164.1 AAA family ATPase [Pseudalkalibacillus berkeleyi]
MKIKSLHIYGFGRFENERIDFETNGVQVIIGDNESGKSTLMAFIEYMLFGFPKKTEKRLRYEPKTTQAYGGKLVIDSDRHGLVTIERKGGASGSIHVVRSNGREEDESFLQEILSEINLSTYRNIFSFNLDGLQRVGEIRSEELGEYLFNAGLTGAQQLNGISNRLESEQGELFKPNGRNPILNQKIEQLTDLEDKVKRWSNKLDEYNDMKSEHEKISLELAQQEQLRDKWKAEENKLKVFQSIHPIVDQKNALQSQLEQLPQATPFPEEGLERFRRLKERIIELSSEGQHIEDLKSQNEVNRKSIQLDYELLSHEKEIRDLESSYGLIKARQADLDKLQERINQSEREIEEELSLIGNEWTEERIRSVSTDLITKQRLVSILKQNNELENEQKRLDHDLQHARTQIDDNEEKRAQLKERRLNDETVKSYQEQLKNQTSHSPTRLKEQLANMKQMKDTHNSKKTTGMMSWLLIGLGILLAVVWVLNGDLIAGLVIGISLVGTGVVLANKKNSTDINGLDEQIQALENELSQQTFDDTEVERLEKIIYEQQHLTLQGRHLEEQAVELEKRYQKIARQYDNWELDDHETKDQLAEIRQHIQMPDHIPNDMMLELFERIDRLKRRFSELSNWKTERAKRLEEVEAFSTRLSRLTEFEITDHHSMDQAMRTLASNWKRTQDQQNSLLKLKDEQEDLMKRFESVKKKITLYEKEIQELFDKADVNDEETFWVRGKANEKFRQLNEQLEMRNAHLKHTTTEQLIKELEEAYRSSDQIDTDLTNVQERLDQSDKTIDGLRDEGAKIQAQIAQLEKDGSYSHHLHAFEAAKSEFNEQAKRWAILKTAQYALEVAKQNYQSEKQPKIIQRAESYFSELTEKRYQRLIAPKDDESFLIERNDQMLFKPEELSRATMEQLYLALRFALGEEYEHRGYFPFIMDDIFVNFDQKRRLLASKLINRIAENRQILYFTCHETTGKNLSDHCLYLPQANTMQPQAY